MIKILKWLIPKKKQTKNKYSNEFDSSQVRKFCKLKPDKKDLRDYKYTTGITTGLPISGDTRDVLKFTDIKHQGNANTCSAFASCSILEAYRNTRVEGWDFSELFVYYNSKCEPGKDTGAYLRDVCKSLQQQGATLESFWPYDLTQINTEPSWGSYFSANYARIKNYFRIENITQIKEAIINSKPVLVGMQVYPNFVTLPRGTIYKKTSGSSLGGHAMVIVAYDDAKSAFLLRNSWGTSWGDNGYGWIDYNTLTTNMFDLWVLEE
jgi:C1A family cysteine protease